VNRSQLTVGKVSRIRKGDMAFLRILAIIAYGSLAGCIAANAQPPTPGPDEVVGSPEAIQHWQRTVVPTLQAGLQPDQTLDVGLMPRPAGFDPRLPLEVKVTATQISVGNAEYDVPEFGGWWLNAPNLGEKSGNIAGCTIPLVKVPADQAPGGPIKISTRTKVRVRTSNDPSKPMKLAAQFWTQTTTSVTLPPGLLPVRLIHDRQAALIMQTIVFSPFEWRISDPDPRNRGYTLSFNIDASPAPQNLAYEIQLTAAGKAPITLSSFACRKGEKIHAHIIARVGEFIGGTYTLTFSPSPEVAAKAGIPEILGDKLVAKTVVDVLKTQPGP
jgi:hypothetical protein